jgi:3-oxoacyl-[acyl-carrier-protein] synthase I
VSKAAHIVAVGARCAIGLNAESAAAALRAGIRRLAEHPFMLDANGDPLTCATDARLDPTVLGAARLARLGESPLGEVARKLRGASPLGVRVLLALPEVRPGFSADDRAAALHALQAWAQASLPDAAPRIAHVGDGHAGALAALQAAAWSVSEGGEDVCIAGGVDSYLHADTLEWLEAGLLVARKGARAGFFPGEGAAMVAVASDDARTRLGLSSLGVVRGIATTVERRDPKGNEGLLGEALGEAVLQATRTLQIPREMVSEVYGDINGERPRTDDWGFALLRTSVRFRDGTQYVTAAGHCGDVGAATAALGCVLAVRAWQRGYARGPLALVWAGSWGGLRGAALLEDRRN